MDHGKQRTTSPACSLVSKGNSIAASCVYSMCMLLINENSPAHATNPPTLMIQLITSSTVPTACYGNIVTLVNQVGAREVLQDQCGESW